MKALSLWAIVLSAAGVAAQAPQVGVASDAQLTTDVYRVHFDRAAPGQAAALGERLRVQDKSAPMPGHYLVLRHQEGDDWDYCVIEHLGPKTASATAVGLARDAGALSAWHDDTNALGPSWPDFAAAMGIDAPVGKPDVSIYVLSIYGAATGHRDQLERLFMRPNAPGAKVATTAVALKHVEGDKWNFLYLTRYNSWADLAADRAAAAQLTGAADTWAEAREHTSFHRDTIADRIR